jgi:hypothetical protein
MEEICSSETSVLARALRHDIQEDSVFHCYGREKIKSFAKIFSAFLLADGQTNVTSAPEQLVSVSPNTETASVV